MLDFYIFGFLNLRNELDSIQLFIDPLNSISSMKQELHLVASLKTAQLLQWVLCHPVDDEPFFEDFNAIPDQDITGTPKETFRYSKKNLRRQIPKKLNPRTFSGRIYRT